MHDATNSKATITGTMKYTNMIKEDRVRVKVASNIVKRKGRGEWLLLQAFERRANGDLFVGKKAGYVVLMDKKPVVFYSNDLNTDPNDGFEGKESPHAMHCVHGLAFMHRWTGDESLGHTRFQVPAMIASYNTHMNGVDRLDQARAISPIKRKEVCVSRSIFSFVLDSCVQNAYAVSATLGGEKRSLYDFKLALAKFLMSGQGQRSPSRKKTAMADKATINIEDLKVN